MRQDIERQAKTAAELLEDGGSLPMILLKMLRLVASLHDDIRDLQQRIRQVERDLQGDEPRP